MPKKIFKGIRDEIKRKLREGYVGVELARKYNVTTQFITGLNKEVKEEDRQKAREKELKKLSIGEELEILDKRLHFKGHVNWVISELRKTKQFFNDWREQNLQRLGWGGYPENELNTLEHGIFSLEDEIEFLVDKSRKCCNSDNAKGIEEVKSLHSVLKQRFEKLTRKYKKGLDERSTNQKFIDQLIVNLFKKSSNEGECKPQVFDYYPEVRTRAVEEERRIEEHRKDERERHWNRIMELAIKKRMTSDRATRELIDIEIVREIIGI